MSVAGTMPARRVLPYPAVLMFISMAVPRIVSVMPGQRMAARTMRRMAVSCRPAVRRCMSMAGRWVALATPSVADPAPPAAALMYLPDRLTDYPDTRHWRVFYFGAAHEQKPACCP